MVTLRFAVPAILAAAAAAGCFTYFITPSAARVEADQRLSPTAPNLRDPDTTASTSIEQRLSADEKAAAAYQKAAGAVQVQSPSANQQADDHLDAEEASTSHGLNLRSQHNR